MREHFGVCLLTTVAIREQPVHSSQMVSQLLFGMTYEILEKAGHWYRIRVLFDDYEGYIHRAQHTEIELEYIECEKMILRSQGLILNGQGVHIPVLPGSELPVFLGKRFEIGDIGFEVLEGEFKPWKSGIDLFLLEAWMGVSYLWGGLSHWGADCSGFVQTFFKTCGIKISRDSYQQAQQGEEIPFGFQQAGDVVFFGEDNITHTGIVSGEGRVIHCYGYVREDILDSKGIYSDSFHEHTHKLKSIRRYKVS